MHVDHLGIHTSVEEVFPPERLAEALADLDPNVSVVEGDYDGVDAVVTFDHDPDFLDHVDWIHTVQAGYDKFPLDELRERDIVLTNSTGIHGASVGEFAVGQMLSLARRLHEHRDKQHDHEWEWPDWDDPFTLFNEQVTVVGLGTLGQGVARRADGIGMRVVGVRRTPTRTPHTREVYTPDRLREAIEDARFVVVTTPLTEATRGLLGADEFDAMREDAYLVNVARGPVVDQDALVDALESGEITGAALDVFEEEPLPEDSPLWDMDDVLVSPHAAAADRDYYRDVADIVRQNVLHLDADEELVNRVV
ncbi:D-2-hydroxyacid dehydrogenase [Halospeciosus flavus]|uniref:D-2-hydroxyacid dehydrogenase n=1 Tax=Halospeciosus flavus TaxID=3032283 RepID=A0ABD5Z754_9EURY|nr:D-2-hydroxyacid dehydrogenase [Halospeciosus flavus]